MNQFHNFIDILNLLSTYNLSENFFRIAGWCRHPRGHHQAGRGERCACQPARARHRRQGHQELCHGHPQQGHQHPGRPTARPGLRAAGGRPGRPARPAPHGQRDTRVAQQRAPRSDQQLCATAARGRGGGRQGLPHPHLCDGADSGPPARRPAYPAPRLPHVSRQQRGLGKEILLELPSGLGSTSEVWGHLKTGDLESIGARSPRGLGAVTAPDSGSLKYFCRSVSHLLWS